MRKLIELYRAALGQDIGNLMETVVRHERERILELVEAQVVGDCCWQYHSGHVNKTELIKGIEGGK